MFFWREGLIRDSQKKGSVQVAFDSNLKKVSIDEACFYEPFQKKPNSKKLF